MAQFTTRVELHHADDEDYKTLHAAMEDEGFSRTILSGDNVAYHLPTAEYDRISNLTRNDILKSAQRAAALTGCRFGVIVTESKGSTWWGLPKV
jgi:hypothetical protein